VHAEAAAGQQGKKDFRLNKDLVVYWRLAPNQPASVDLMTFKPDANGRGTFMMVMTPGSDLKPIQRGKDWTFVVDMSGSMKGKFNTVMQGLDMAFNKLTPQDRVRVIGFNRQAWDVSNGFVHADPADLGQLIRRLKERGPNGGTNLYAGLQEAARIVDDDRTSSIVLVTDGVANVGKTARNEFLDLVNQHDLRLFTMIMGNSANRPLLTDLTDASGGFAISVSNADDVVGQLLRAVGKVSHEAMHNVQVTARGVRTADIVRSRDSSLYFGDQLMVFGHYWGDGDTTFQLDAEVSGQPRQWQANVRLPGVSQDNPEIERLWAYGMIRQLQRQQSRLGESADTKQAIIDIATQYSLVTDNTSMVVMTEQAFAERGIERRNQARTTIEQTAQQQRAARPVTSRRVDQAQPTFQGNRPQVSGGNSSRSGGGHINLLFLLMLAVPLVAQRVRRGAAAKAGQ
jgi:Ca-activated chloride channel family protein